MILGALAAAPGPALAAMPRIESHQCDNGLTVLVSESHALPLVTIEVGVKNGSMTESPEYNGLSHLYEHMFFKSNRAIPSQEAYLARARELGMVWNGTTNTERVNYFFTTTTDHLDAAMVFMRDAIVGPLFVTNILWFTAVARVGAPRAVIVNNLQPFVGVLFAMLLLSESLHPLEIAGGVLIFIGIYLERRMRHQSVAAARALYAPS